MGREVLLLVTCIIMLVASNTLPNGRASSANIAMREDVSTLKVMAADAALLWCPQRIDDYFIVKFATIQTGDEPIVLIGLPFSGKYYRYD
jgi:hypothetical protein